MSSSNPIDQLASAMSGEEVRTQRNAVFTQEQQSVPNQLPSSMAGMPVITAGEVPLPSRGFVYGPESPLHQQEFVDIKAMTAKEEDILMSKALIRKGTVITELLRSCILNKAIDVNAMLSGDRNAIMVAVRITGYGSEYLTKIICPSCDLSQDYPFDLTQLPVKELNLDVVKQVRAFENLFSFTMPLTKKEVQFKFLTGKEEEQILQLIETRKKKGFQNDNLITTRLLSSIVSIDGREDRNYITSFIQNMPARDSLALRHHIDKNEPGVEMKGDFTCNSCGHQEEVAVPMGPSFFWPAN